MRKLPKVFTIALLLFLQFSAIAQTNFFKKISEETIAAKASLQRVIIPEEYITTTLDTRGLQSFLWSLPGEKAVMSRSQPGILVLPMPDGGTARFTIWESSVMEPGLEKKFQEIKTFAGRGIDDPYATIKAGYDPYFGFHAQVLSPSGAVYVDPYARGSVDNYISYYAKNNKRFAPFVCEIEESVTNTVAARTMAACRGNQLYTYRLAVACTGEYAEAVGATTASNPAAALHAAIVKTVTRVNGIYENELAIRLVLIANNDAIEFLSATGDPFAGNNSAGTLISESQTVITTNIGSANYDIGHTFSTGGGGLASLGVVCNNNLKARGITGSPNPVGDSYDIDYVAHEIGHQFGASHTFNSSASSCGGGNRSATEAYEPGSGTTIQAYAGICGTDNIQPFSDPYFHAISFDQISNFIEAGGASCRVVTSTGNTLPVITAMNNNGVSIPLNTPFTLTGTATDADGDALTYSWEQWDLGPTTTWNGGNSTTTSPLFKSRIPKTTGSRTFPDMAVIVAGYPTSPGATMGGLKGETLPTVARAMKFRMTVRDNHPGGGGVVSGGSGCASGGFETDFVINTVAGTGPFTVAIPNGGESWSGNSAQNITWNVAGTNAAPINCTNVKISLSTDGGFTYPTVLVASTPNDGAELVTLPNVTSSTARIKIEAVGNVFFDISNNDFAITVPVPSFDFITPSPLSVTCGSATPAAVTVATNSILGFTTPVNLSATGLPAGTTVTFNPATITPGSSTIVTLNNANTLLFNTTHTITVRGEAGSVIRTIPVTFTIAPGAGPVITAQPQAVQVCDNSAASFAVSSSGPTPAYQWQQSSNGGVSFQNLSGATTANNFSIPSVILSQDNYRYRVLLTGQCNTTVSNAALLTVYGLPTVTLSANPFSSLFPGRITTVSAAIIPGSSSVITPTWFQNNNSIGLVNGNSLQLGVTGIGTYQVKLEDANGCKNESPVLSITAAPSSRLFIYPSPNNGQFTVSYFNSAGSTARQSVTVYDSKGARVYSNFFSFTGAYGLHSIDLRGAGKGIYYVVVGDATGKKIIEGKVVVH